MGSNLLGQQVSFGNFDFFLQGIAIDFDDFHAVEQGADALDIMGIPAGIWGLLSTLPFLYILYVLFIELGKSLSRQSKAVQTKIKLLRILLIATWGVYPITFILAMGTNDAPSFQEVVNREVGYSIADILAKCVFGLIIFTVARIKSAEESKEFAAAELRD